MPTRVLAATTPAPAPTAAVSGTARGAARRSWSVTWPRRRSPTNRSTWSSAPVDAPLADPTAGVAEIGRVLRPGARVLVWDLRPASGPQVVHETQPTAQPDEGRRKWACS